MNADLDDGATMRSTLENALQDVQAPADLGRDAIARGHRLQDRRRLGFAAGGVAAVAAVALIAVPVLGEGAGRAIDDTGMVSSPTPTGPVATAGAPSTADVDPENPWPDLERPEGWWDMPAAEMLSVLEDHLPAGVSVADADPPGEGRNRPGSLEVVLAGPGGTGLVSILLQAPPLEDLPPPVTSTDADGDEQVSVMLEGVPYERRLGCRPTYLKCALIRDETGAEVGDVSTELDNGTTYHNADLVGPEGGAINIYVADSTGEKPGYEPPTAEAPLLTFGQVRALVEDPIWTSYHP